MTQIREKDLRIQEIAAITVRVPPVESASESAEQVRGTRRVVHVMVTDAKRVTLTTQSCDACCTRRATAILLSSASPSAMEEQTKLKLPSVAGSFHQCSMLEQLSSYVHFTGYKLVKQIGGGGFSV